MKTKDIQPDTEYTIDLEAVNRHLSLGGSGILNAYADELGRSRNDSMYPSDFTVKVIEVGVERMHSERKDGVVVQFPKKVADYLNDARPRHVADNGKGYILTSRCIEEPLADVLARIETGKREKQEREDERRAQLAALTDDISPVQIGSLIAETQEKAKQSAKDLLRYLRDLQESVAEDIKRLEERTQKVEDWEEKIPGFYRNDLAPRPNDDGVLLYPIIDRRLGTSHLERDSQRAIEALMNYNSNIEQFNTWQYMRKAGEES